jgi:cbb3-type cytochrome oxidase cytochrome c subunit/mono/diheme cytochrome c family protein
MVMNFITVGVGAFIVFLTAITIVVALPLASFEPKPSDRARPLTALEDKGRDIYISNGCWYCHSQTNRPQDLAIPGLTTARTDRPSQSGDWAYVRPTLIGSERVGPDLAQIGGVLSDDWHLAHFINPRYTSPGSIMPNFDWLNDKKVSYTDEQGQKQEVTGMVALTAYIQSLGGKDADARRAVELAFGKLRRGEIQDVQVELDAIADPSVRSVAKEYAAVREKVVTDWATFDTNPLTLNNSVLALGKKMFFGNCIGCHGTKGDGNGPGAQFLSPRPADFTAAVRPRFVSPGTFYETILNGRLGTAMHPFGNRLSVEEIWSLEWFLRTLPNGGAEQVPKVDMVVPFEGTPVAATPGATATPTPGAATTQTATPTPSPTATPSASAGDINDSDDSLVQRR